MYQKKSITTREIGLQFISNIKTQGDLYQKFEEPYHSFKHADCFDYLMLMWGKNMLKKVKTELYINDFFQISKARFEKTPNTQKPNLTNL